MCRRRVSYSQPTRPLDVAVGVRILPLATPRVLVPGSCNCGIWNCKLHLALDEKKTNAMDMMMDEPV